MTPVMEKSLNDTAHSLIREDCYKSIDILSLTGFQNWKKVGNLPIRPFMADAVVPLGPTSSLWSNTQ